jgi:hypothetical protein
MNIQFRLCPNVQMYGKYYTKVPVLSEGTAEYCLQEWMTIQSLFCRLWSSGLNTV